jgi:hypothetical protein
LALILKTDTALSHKQHSKQYLLKEGFANVYPSWNSKRKCFILLERGLIYVVCIYVEEHSQEDHDGKQDKSRAVVNYPKEGQQEDPEHEVIKESNYPAGIRGRLVYLIWITRLLAKPCEPHGRMVLNQWSIYKTDDGQPDHPTQRRPSPSRESPDHIEHCRKAQG